MGVDSGIRSFKVRSAKDILPSWLHEGAQVQEGFQLEHDIGHDNELPAMPPQQLQPLLKFAIEVPGSLHIISNLPKDLDTKLVRWREHMAKLKVFEKLLGDGYHRERIRATCLLNAGEASEAFKHFSGNLYEHRWFSVYIFVARSYPLIKILEDKWDVKSYIQGFSKDKSDADKDRQFSPHDVGRILKDPLFHAYNNFVLAVGTILRRLSSWTEGCPCHEQYIRQIGSWRRRPVSWKAIFPSMLKPRCLIAGCRAPELAAGEIEGRLLEIASMGQDDLIRKFREGLPGVDRAAVLHDFGIAKSYLECGLRLKFDCWSKLPWRLAALGHHDATVRTSTAQEVIEMYDKSIAAGYNDSMQHPLSVKFLALGSLLRGECEALATSGIMGDLLALEAGRLKFIPVAERALNDRQHITVRFHIGSH
jgi:hypothetical protein